MSIELRGLVLRQPWLSAIMNGGKRVENRLKWKGCTYRGNVALCAASGMTRPEYLEVIKFLNDRGIPWRPELAQNLLFSAVAVKAKIVDVIMPGGFRHMSGAPPSWKSTERHPMAEDRWYMGGFALVLDSEITVLEKPIHYASGGLWYMRDGNRVVDVVRGSKAKPGLGLFHLPPEVERAVYDQAA